jgi:peptide/nickel transport system ATP-binding protein/oligopeptide transport system ATP-binding protein
MSAAPPALEVTDLAVTFRTERGDVPAVRGISFTLEPGESLAILGESGSGKSATAHSLLGLVDPPGEVTGSVRFGGTELVAMSERDLNTIRGRELSMVFQDSLDSLNPVFSIGSQLGEVFRARAGLSRAAAADRAVELMAAVGIRDPRQRMNDYPHQFSGGMRQRICIAMAIALDPNVLIADEPTTALDVTIQAGILRLLRTLQRERDMSLIFVTHDLAVARMVADSVIVMRHGRIVERGVLEDVFRNPRHPYTQALLDAHPARATRWQDLRPGPEHPGLATPAGVSDEKR